MKRDTLVIFTVIGIYCAIFNTSAWSVNNFLMTGPKAYLTYSSSVAAGAHLGIEECKHQFIWERWNCPESALQLSTHNKLRSGGKGWVWGGCSDNVEFGERISKHFVDALETGHDARAVMNLHNNEAGRLAVKATMKRTCKCHGISGSCSIKTCWLQLAEFREIGIYLKLRYGQAQKLEMDKRRRSGNSADSRGATGETLNSMLSSDLVFLEESPNYCIENDSLGLHGTEGRECVQSGKSLSQWEKRSCRRLCMECGLTVEEKKTDIVTNCNCKFHWCCTVKCEQCKQVVTKYFCSKRVTSSSNHIRRRNKGPRG
ncbi:protein Wnt-8a isoform X3 [Hemicordylus capensis]|uniref:protein Wnt-8a isoform X3 n=1 Tax=Hemicordylus capensis TaxID=884348 RepID=UPI0023032C9D|nr:protein Wnt-8a isoform X3 [Hemicordylus capensis]